MTFTVLASQSTDGSFVISMLDVLIKSLCENCASPSNSWGFNINYASVGKPIPTAEEAMKTNIPICLNKQYHPRVLNHS